MKTKFLLSLIGVAISYAVCTGGAATDKSQNGRVYVLSNKPENSVLVFNRASNGSLTFIQEASTQGAGTGATGDPLQSQGSVALSADNKVLLAVNPASGELTAFRVIDAGLQGVAFRFPQVGRSRDVKDGRLIFKCVGDGRHHIGESGTGGDQCHAQTAPNPRNSVPGQKVAEIVSVVVNTPPDVIQRYREITE